MLACVLIRMALADAFGAQCSTIALDEPTTNLDSDKARFSLYFNIFYFYFIVSAQPKASK